MSSSCWVLPLPGAHVPGRAGRSQGIGGRNVCLHAGKWDYNHGEGEWGPGSASLDPSSGSEGQWLSGCLGWVSGCFLAGTSSRPGCPLPALRQLEAVLGRGGCGRAGIVFLCHRKQLPGVSQAGSGLPVSLGQAEPLSQPADGRGTPNALQEWLSNLEHLRTQGGFEPSPCPIPSACREPAVCCFPEPGFAGGSLCLVGPGRLSSLLGGGSKGQEEQSCQNTLEFALKEHFSSFLLKFLVCLEGSCPALSALKQR